METLIKTASKSTATGNHSYTGWNELYYYVINDMVYRRVQGRGAFAQTDYAEKLGEFKPSEWKDYCWEEKEVDLDLLPANLQEVAGILMQVPDGEIVCEYISGNVIIYIGGEMVPPTLYRQEHVLKNGETHEYEYRIFTGRSFGRWQIKNVEGKPENSITEFQIKKDKEEKAAFFREKLELVIGRGFAKDKAVKIVTAAGPGAVCPTLAWLDKLNVSQLQLLSVVLTGYQNLPDFPEFGLHCDGLVNSDIKDHDAWECINNGIVNAPFGKARRINALERVGIPAPDVGNANWLGKVLTVAKEILPKPNQFIGFGNVAVTLHSKVVSPGKHKTSIPKEYREFKPSTMGELMRKSNLI